MLIIGLQCRALHVGFNRFKGFCRLVSGGFMLFFIGSCNSKRGWGAGFASRALEGFVIAFAFFL